MRSKGRERENRPFLWHDPNPSRRQQQISNCSRSTWGFTTVYAPYFYGPQLNIIWARFYVEKVPSCCALSNALLGHMNPGTTLVCIWNLVEGLRRQYIKCFHLISSISLSFSRSLQLNYLEIMLLLISFCCWATTMHISILYHPSKTRRIFNWIFFINCLLSSSSRAIYFNNHMTWPRLDHFSHEDGMTQSIFLYPLRCCYSTSSSFFSRQELLRE